MKKIILVKSIPVIALILGVSIGLSFSISALAQTINVYKQNEKGLTYGTMEYVVKNSSTRTAANVETPDLIACEGIDGTVGYCYKSDLDGKQPETPKEAVKYMEELDKQISEAIANGERYIRYIPLYESDGVTVIGEFGIGIPFAFDSESSNSEEIVP